MRAIVIMACFNRRDTTVRSIEGARLAADVAGVELSFVVFDDGSTDGTAEALAGLCGQITVLRGDGTYFWARGMATAEAAALESIALGRIAPADGAGEIHLVWLNDDVFLDDDAFLRLAETVAAHPGAIIAGATRDPEGGHVTYSGLASGGRHPLNFKRIAPTNAPQRVTTFNGNLVVVPASVAARIGGIDGGFSHALADIDYGLRAQRLGIAVLLSPGTCGTCPENPAERPQPAGAEWQRFLGAKGGGNYPSLRLILMKSHRRSWFAFVASTYALWWLRRIAPPVKALARGRSGVL